VPDDSNEIQDVGLWPTYSEFSSRLSRIRNSTGGQSDLILTSRNNRTHSSTVRLSEPLKRQASGDGSESVLTQTLGPSPQPFLRSLAFSNQDNSVVVRDNGNTFLLFPLRAGDLGERFEITIPAVAATQRAPRPAFFTPRPLLASVLVGEKWRIAWLSEKGVILIRGELGSGAPLLKWPPLLPSISSLDSASRIRFSDDGEKLVLVQQRGGGQANVRVWDLSEARQLAIRGMTHGSIRREACRVAALEEHGNKFTQDEQASWLNVSETQPCEGI